MEHKIIDQVAFFEYKKLIKSNYIRFSSKSQLKTYKETLSYYTELHHIIPISMGGKDVVTNLVCLSASDHFIAHKLLYQMFQNKEMTFAFNQMRRVLHHYPHLKEEYSYHEFRENLSKYLSEGAINRFKNMPEEMKHELAKKISMITKGTYIVRDKDTGICKRIDRKDFDVTQHMFTGTGSRRSESTKKLMSEKAARDIKGIQYHNPKTGEIRYFIEGSEPKEFIKGTGIQNKHTKGTIFFHDPKTGNQIRCSPENAPSGWIKGRYTFNNSFKDKIVVKNIITGEVLLTKELIPFYTTPRANAIFSYIDKNMNKKFTGSMTKMSNDLDIDPSLLLKSIMNPDYKIGNRNKKNLKDQYFGKNIAKCMQIKMYMQNELTEDVCIMLVSNYEWIG